MNDYVIHAKLKNNNILRRILDQGKTVGAFCTEHRLSPSEVGDFINLKKSAVTSTGDWRAGALKLADALGVLPEELFVEEQATAQLRTNEAFVEMSREQILRLPSGTEMVERAIDLQRVVPLLLANCTDREKRVLHLLYGEDETLEVAAKELGITRERVRQIEMNALKKARGAAFKSNLSPESITGGH